MNQKKTSGGTVGRYMLRHILRFPGKSLLCLLLAAVFMLGLMLIRVSAIRSENELERLYTTTVVTVDLVKNTSTPGYDTSDDLETGFIYPSTVDRLAETGFISHRYVEGSVKNTTLVRTDAQGNAVGRGRFSIGGATLYGIEDPQKFLAQRNMVGEITYFEGWDESAFLQSWSDWQTQKPGGILVYPTVMSRELYDLFQMEDGDLLRVAITTSDGLVSSTVTTQLTVIGTYPGEMRTLLFPVNSLKAVNGADLKYDQVTLAIDPAQNRRLEEFRAMAAPIISRGSTVPTIALYRDQELRQAIAPMEQIISFMKALYPVTLGLSFIVAAGIAILLSLLSAKEAAILRVLGNSKTQCRVILCLQTVAVCMVGLVVGHLGATAMAYIMLPTEDAAGLLLPALGRAGLYLLYTILGAVGASAVMTAKNPLELLQVKE